MQLHIGVDVGGTFTDITVSEAETNRQFLHKLPSTPAQPERAIIDGIRHILTSESLNPAQVARLSHGTTVGTNSLIQRKVGRVAVVTTKGFRDLLDIGRQTRPKVYDIHLDYPAPLVPRELRLEVSERLLADGRVHQPLDEAGLITIAARLKAASIDSVVVCFLNSYAFAQHEQRAADILSKLLPASVYVVTSSGTFPEFREYERFSTAVLNAALFTVMHAYLDRFASAALDLGVTVEPDISQSVGGLMSLSMAREIPLRASLSGPAAGVTAVASRAKASGVENVITLDMGGTSADVSLLVNGRATEVQDRMLAGFPLRMPSLDVNAVGAGGGSIAWIDIDGLLKIGPQSAGAHPGPACYGLGGTAATVTDANVVLGRLSAQALLDGTMPIDKELAVTAIQKLADALHLRMEETAQGIVQVTCAVMVKAVRAISVERGHDPAGFALYAFGGAGPLHATEVARELDIRRVVIPPNPGILCAEGLLQSDRRADFVKTVFRRLQASEASHFEAVWNELSAQSESWFEREAVSADQRALNWTADLRYVGQNFELTLPITRAELETSGIAKFSARFHLAHDTAYGFSSSGETIEVVNLRVTATGELDKPPIPRLPVAASGPRTPVPASTRNALFDGHWLATPVYRREDLDIDLTLTGPAIIEQLDTTSVVHPGDQATVDPWGNLVIELQPA